MTPGFGPRQITDALVTAGVRPDDTLFVHSDLRRALRVAGDTREQKMDSVLRGLRDAVPRGVLMLPTFTYSFCEGEDFDVQSSASAVGVLTEYFREQPGVHRSTEPIFSVAWEGELDRTWQRRLRTIADCDCFGERSVFGYLREVGARIAFLGVDFEYCTYVYHVEQRLRVPYRYMKAFSGTVRDGRRSAPVTARYFVRDLERDVVNHFEPLGRDLLRTGDAVQSTLAGGPRLLVCGTASITARIERALALQPDFLLRRGHPPV